MTDMLERPAPLVSFRRRNPRQEGSDCANAYHGRNDAAYRRGCRCPAAIAAHDAPRPPRLRKPLPAAIGDDGRCVAPIHDSYVAFRHGCRCPRSTAAAARAVEIDRRRDDPRLKWRGPDARVDRNALLHLLAGYPDLPTPAEIHAAVAILSRRGVPSGTGLFSRGEIAERLGVGTEVVDRARRRMERLAGQRAERRLADVRFKAMRAERARARRG